MVSCRTVELFSQLLLILFFVTLFSVSISEDTKEEEETEEKRNIECYVCQSVMGDGSPNKNCLGNETINREITWITNCTTKCFVRTDDFKDGVIYRGCPDVYYKMPSPLPEDGCYKWYLDVWCICSTPLCNYVALGEPKDIELDAHLPDEETGSSGRKNSLSFFLGVSHLIIIFLLYKMAAE